MTHPNINSPTAPVSGGLREQGKERVSHSYFRSQGAGCLINNYAPRQQIAALFVETGGSYYGIPGVDPWDKARDAMKYRGPHPVIAHPPCQLWGNLASVNYARWGGEHNRPGNDGGAFAFALYAVNKWGGVLEHPASTKAWAAHDIDRPVQGGWIKSGGGWVCEVWQSAYGHRANKATWLYFVGDDLPPSLDWSRPVGTHQIGHRDQRGKAANKPTVSKREASATPEPFRDLLIDMARGSRGMRQLRQQQEAAE